MRNMVNKNHVAGLAKQVKGAVKQAVGKATGNRRTQAEGMADKVAGKVQKVYGDVKDKVRKAL
ncbi:CsbD family protein [Mesorhizobium intechi]|uniref:CsbD family protein n=1 Tax=Mesorhizobium intechi TaxID=537601 RepID=UPI00142EEAEF|nr:CsbD family protein [Mesorhizobium intechi]